MVLLVSPIEITVHKTMDKTSQTAFVSSHSGGVYSGLAKLSNTISFLLSGRIRNLPDLIICFSVEFQTHKSKLNNIAF